LKVKKLKENKHANISSDKNQTEKINILEQKIKMTNKETSIKEDKKEDENQDNKSIKQ
jgi:hypothetical protein